jgi:hypothetical protein
MVLFRARPATIRRILMVAVAAGLGIAPVGRARAAKNDLQLLNLCGTHTISGIAGVASECSWISRDPTSHSVTGFSLDADAQSRFRSLMSELGVVMAPRLQTPADTLGYAGFQFSAELGFTKISADKLYWNGVAGVKPDAALTARPDSYLATVGGFVRKGLWLPLPAFEFGAGALSILGSNMYVVQGYAKLALQEGFHGWALPSVAVRGSMSQLLGTDQVDLNVYGVDVIVSKAFGIAGTWRLEPFVGWNLLFIDAQSGVIDATPSCDAVALAASAGTGKPPANSACALVPPGGDPFSDYKANFTFAQQDVITRQRWSAGFKLKLSVVFLVGELDIAPAGHSQGGAASGNARDTSGTQQSFALSGGFDF